MVDEKVGNSERGLFIQGFGQEGMAGGCQKESISFSVSPSLCVCLWESEPSHFLVVRQEYVKKFNRDSKGLA